MPTGRNTSPQYLIWAQKRGELTRTLLRLGFPEDLGDAAARMLGSPRAIDRLNSYLRQVKPKKIEMVVDELLAIRAEIDAWRDKKASEQANMAINEMIWRGFGDEDEDEE